MKDYSSTWTAVPQALWLPCYATYIWILVECTSFIQPLTLDSKKKIQHTNFVAKITFTFYYIIFLKLILNK